MDMTPKGTPNNPPRAANDELYWTSPPPELSPRCVWWVSRINAGWRPGKHVSRLGYSTATGYYGVYIWEYINVLAPILREADGKHP